MTTEQQKTFWQNGQDFREDRENIHNQKSFTLWLTGLSGSGKSTISHLLEKHLINAKNACHVLDGDNIRHGINKDLGFSPADRAENIRRVAEIAKILNDAGLIVIASFISPYIVDREIARKIIGENSFKEIYINTPFSICEARDVKGLYKKAREGKILEFTGVSAPYEPPTNPDLIVTTETNSAETATQIIIDLINSPQHKNPSHLTY